MTDSRTGAENTQDKPGASLVPENKAVLKKIQQCWGVSKDHS